MCFSVQVERDLRKLSKLLNAKIDAQAFDKFLKSKEQDPQSFKAPDVENRIYPNYYAPVVILENGIRTITPMRYQLLPSFCKETKYTRINEKTGRKNLVKSYNARLDALESRHAWKGNFLNHHVLIPFRKFYEYIPRKSKVEVAAFYQEGEELMLAAGLFDRWQSVDGSETLNSFAIITDDPPREVLAAGHDRCPILLKNENIDTWLDSQKLDSETAYNILKEPREGLFKYDFLK
ncbi:hypothetical protein A9Q84_15800 [Halobacteriovorax marinus]|uniref:Abasic site processing protein n=1 Tax=Halobacteriovorax marinus TaxID=97084 RepID=A0A1Y5FAG2_9BACT|nr:hypothetical protein A9Q84_15800 [Halobacteriovorax marinus]